MRSSTYYTNLELVMAGVLMVSLGSVLFCLEPLLTNPVTELDGYLVAVLFTAMALLVPLIRLWRTVSRGDRRQRMMYLLTVESLLACWVTIWIMQSSPFERPRMLALLTGVHGVLWGLWLLALAIQVQSRTYKAALVTFMAALTSVAGMLIAVEKDLSRLAALNLVACHITWIGTLLLSLELYLYRTLIMPHAAARTAKEVEDERDVVTT